MLGDQLMLRNVEHQLFDKEHLQIHVVKLLHIFGVKVVYFFFENKDDI
tara:strand:+ start:351 stop:494 length:144 start_codon:yes stop_codon:yes gene_type:complete